LAQPKRAARRPCELNLSGRPSEADADALWPPAFLVTGTRVGGTRRTDAGDDEAVLHSLVQEVVTRERIRRQWRTQVGERSRQLPLPAPIALDGDCYAPGARRRKGLTNSLHGR